jgi:WD40 repeat protein
MKTAGPACAARCLLVELVPNHMAARKAFGFGLFAVCVALVWFFAWIAICTHLQAPQQWQVPSSANSQKSTEDSDPANRHANHIAFSPDGRLRAENLCQFTESPGLLRVFRISDEMTVADLGDGVDSCAWSEDSSFLAVARSKPLQIELWDARTWKLTDRITAPATPGEASAANGFFGNPCFDHRGNLYVVRRNGPFRNSQEPWSRTYAWWRLPAGRARDLETIGSLSTAEAFNVSASTDSDTETCLAISYVSKNNSKLRDFYAAIDRSSLRQNHTTQGHSNSGNTTPIEILKIRFDAAGHRTIKQDCTLAADHEAWVRLTPDGKNLAVLADTDNYALSVYKLGSRGAERMWSLPGCSDNPFDPKAMQEQRIDVSRDGRLVAFVRRYEIDDYGVEVRQISDQKLAGAIRNWIPALAFSADGRLAVSDFRSSVTLNQIGPN